MMKYEVHIYKDASQKPSIIKTVSGDITAARRA